MTELNQERCATRLLRFSANGTRQTEIAAPSLVTARRNVETHADPRSVEVERAQTKASVDGRPVVIVGNVHIKVTQHHHQRGDALVHGKVAAGAIARAVRERNEGSAHDLVLEAIRVEGERILPVLGVAMDVAGREPHTRAARDDHLVHLHVLGELAADERGRRAQAQALHVAALQELELLDIVDGGHAALQHRVDFCARARDQIRALREKV
mmetsp:Transcript_17918/g.45508  ORF Transcript_17918/g.45508 Transcript_17918/m.45508 type:complete len:212 (+) Transcript_17918:124-759(+)